MSSDNSVDFLRSSFIAEIDAAIVSIGSSPKVCAITSDCFSIDDDGTLLFRLSFRGRRLMLPSDDSVLSSETLDDLLEQLDQMKIIAGFGGLDKALIEAANCFI